MITNVQERAALIAKKEEIIRLIEASLKERLTAFDLKQGSKKALDLEASFLSGAMCALQVLVPNENPKAITALVPPRWVMSCMTGRSVLDPL